MRRAVSIVIPSHNGKCLLEKNLPSVAAAVAARDAGDEIIVVDNGSSDGTAKFLAETFPGVRVIELERNEGFGYACNRGVTESGNDIVVLLNNDVRVSADFVGYVTPHFEKNGIFAVMCRDENERRGKDVPDGIVPVLYASGGYSAYDREKFLLLGMFHPLYTPFYGEDRDMGYRAWKRGWPSILEPRSIVFHAGEETARRMEKKYVESVKFRNRLFFYLSCYEDASLALTHCARRILQEAVRRPRRVFPVLNEVRRRYAGVRQKRLSDKPFWKYGDRRILRGIARARSAARTESCRGRRSEGT